MAHTTKPQQATHTMLTTLAVWLTFITVSPFLVTVTHLSAISIVRDLLLIGLVVLAWNERRRTKLSMTADDLEQIVCWIVALAVLSTAFVTHDIGAFIWSARYSLEPFAVFWAVRSFAFETDAIRTLITRWLYWSLGIIVIGIAFVTVIPRTTLLSWGYSDTVAVGNGQWVGGATLPAYQTVAGSVPRIQSTLTGPIQFAGFALLVLFVLPLLPLTIKRHWYYAAVLIALIGVVGSFSRAAWIALFIIALITGLQRLRSNGWQRSEIIAMCIIVLVTLTAVGGSWLTRPNAESSREFVANILTREGSDREHISSISDSVRDVTSHLFVGYGFGRSGAASIQYAATNSAVPDARFVDNSYLRWAEELGVFGAILFLALIWMLLVELANLGTAEGRSLAQAGTALAITALFTDMWLEAVPVLTFFALAGLLRRPREYDERPVTVLFDLFTISRRSLTATTALLTTWAHQVTPRYIVTLNPEMAVTAWQQPAVQTAITHADLITADGAGIIAAIHVAARPLPKTRWIQPIVLAWRWLVSFALLICAPRHLNPSMQRVTGADLLAHLLDDADAKKRRVALLGSTPDVIARAKQQIAARWPHARIVSAETGPHTVSDDGTLNDKDRRALFGKITHAKPHYLFVAFGVPKQEQFLHHYKKELGVPVMIGVSGAFDSVLARTVRRAPSLAQRLHIEWLWRLLRQPQRINRIITALWRFPLLVSSRLRAKSRT